MALNAKASQEFVPIETIQDGIVVLRDGGMRAILMASSINLSLKSEDEQSAIMLQFENFLNSLDFSIQIAVQSRKFDVTSYVGLLNERLRLQNEPLLKIQTQEYINFIQELTQIQNIMTKHFFLVVAFNPPTAVTGGGGLLDRLLPSSKSVDVQKKQKEFDEHRSQLEQRVSLVQQGLSRMGVRTVALETDEEVELFYQTFNPGGAESKLDLDGKV